MKHAPKKPTVEAHVWWTSRVIPQSYCIGCGLIRLRNPLTDLAMDLGCNYKEHPQWPAAVHKHTQFFTDRTK